MKRSTLSRTVAIVMVLLSLTFSVRGVVGQGPGPDQRNIPSAVTGIEAAVASRISYQGMLKESGAPVTGSRNMVFRLHKNSTCTSQVGSNITKNGVSVVNGLFTVTLDVPQSSFNGQALWLQVLVGGVSLGCHEITATPYALSLRPGAVISDTLIGPVLKLVNDPYAVGLRSLVAGGTADDLHPSGWLYMAAGEFVGANGVIGAASDYAASGFGVTGIAQGTLGVGVRGQASAASGTTYGGWFESHSTAGRGVYGTTDATSGTTYGGYFQSISSGGTGVYGAATAASGATYGGYFLNSSTDGQGVRGRAGAASGITHGGYFESVSTNGTGVRGQASATSGAAYGVFGYHNSANGGSAGYFIADNNDAASNVAGVYGRVDGDGAARVPVYGVAGHAYYDGIGVGAWTYNGRIFEGHDGDYPGGTLRYYMERNGAAYADVGWYTFSAAADGSEKVLYGTQSTELWIEDFGTGQLAEGLATVKIATDFAVTVNLNEDYHVFLTPLGDCALYVAEKTATAFTVGAIGGKACSIAFDYRIVAKQSGMESYRLTEIVSPAAPDKVEPAPEATPAALPEPEPSQPVNGQSAP
ncbi:MAG: hypothetical protein RBT75_13800 [Anaerolineae bacterium]|nr:hypothetical protein [Anaerolineae bacterium]